MSRGRRERICGVLRESVFGRDGVMSASAERVTAHDAPQGEREAAERAAVISEWKTDINRKCLLQESVYL